MFCIGDKKLFGNAVLAATVALGGPAWPAGSLPTNKELSVLYNSVTVAYEACPSHAGISDADYRRIKKFADAVASTDPDSAKAAVDTVLVAYTPDPDGFCKIMASKSKSLSSIPAPRR
jgi:hypothetical protein